MKYLPTIFRRDGGNPDHRAILDAIGQALEDAQAQTGELPKELVIDTASGQWLDQWGEWFGVRRRLNESDDDFRSRILETLTGEKMTIPALVNVVKSVLGQDTDVSVIEPFRSTFLLGSSALNRAYLQDGEYYRIGVADIVVSKPITAELTAILNQMKAAGTQIYVTHPVQTVITSLSTSVTPSTAHVSEVQVPVPAYNVSSQLYSQIELNPDPTFANSVPIQIVSGSGSSSSTKWTVNYYGSSTVTSATVSNGVLTVQGNKVVNSDIRVFSPQITFNKARSYIFRMKYKYNPAHQWSNTPELWLYGSVVDNLSGSQLNLRPSYTYKTQVMGDGFTMIEYHLPANTMAGSGTTGRLFFSGFSWSVAGTVDYSVKEFEFIEEYTR